MFINERTLQLRYKLQRGYLTLIAVYAPEEGKLEQTEEFYETLQDHVDKINKSDYIIVAGDYNARVGNIPIDGILGTNGEITINNNGHILKEFASVLIVRRAKLYYTVSGIITPIGVMIPYRCDDTRDCIIQFCTPDDEHTCSKHVEA